MGVASKFGTRFARKYVSEPPSGNPGSATAPPPESEPGFVAMYMIQVHADSENTVTSKPFFALE